MYQLQISSALSWYALLTPCSNFSSKALPSSRSTCAGHHAERRDDAVEDAFAERKLFCIAEPKLNRRPYVRERPVPRRVSRSGFRPAGGATPFRQEQADGEGRGTWESSSAQTEASAAIAERLYIRPGDRVMCTKYVFREAGEPMMLSTSWEPLALTGHMSSHRVILWPSLAWPNPRLPRCCCLYILMGAASDFR